MLSSGESSHAHPGARGNAIFLISVLLAGLQDYHLVTHDPAVTKSIISGARWLASRSP